MYQSILPTLKPLVFEGKSGLLEVLYKYDDRALFFINEGIIEQIETKRLEGEKAATACTRWASITLTFTEGEQSSYLPAPQVDTNAILSYLEKVYKNLKVINENIPDNNAIYKIDLEKLNKSERLNAEDLKIGLLLDGKTSIEQLLAKSEKSELALLTHICKLILAGVARQTVRKKIMPKKEQDSFIQDLTTLLVSLVGPAGPILLEDCFKSIDSEPGMLAREEISPLLMAIKNELDDTDRAELETWSETYTP